MAPSSENLRALAARQTIDNNDNISCDYYGACYSTWDTWGRWVALVVIIVIFLLIALAFSCVNNRRRRRLGMQPMYGTGWFAGKPQGGHYQNTQGYYGQPQPYYGAPAPPYTPSPMGDQMTGNTFNSNEGYYGHHAGGAYELQPPSSAYQPQRGGDSVYEPPAGPPPDRKGNAIIR
ncbi:hypothetical protein BP6252_02818 [Coleophoma cylindrospora]|uniref:Uncharacterized protein n=1 Tax=Coleophoma cylindrospora TaxID=1849047 RepID=A0A3D8SHJ8_9HELO|nr:hypothetical protein BP6252_02818 [Coleophoma cylindrospora]